MKYKLKLAIHSYDKGYTFEEPIGAGYWRDGSGRVLPAELCSLLNKAKDLPELLEPIPDEPTRWTPDRDGKFWFVTYKLETAESLALYIHEQHELNVFQTEEQAQAVANAIKALLEYVHTPFGYDNPSRHISAGRERIFNDAREAVQPEGKE